MSIAFSKKEQRRGFFPAPFSLAGTERVGSFNRKFRNRAKPDPEGEDIHDTPEKQAETEAIRHGWE